MKQRICGFLRAAFCLFFLVAPVFSQSAFAQTFVHPGALSTQADFDRIKAKVAAGEWPWYDSFLNLCNDSHSSLGWGWAPVSTIIRGSGSGNNFARSQQDAIAIYEMALRWRISGDTRYADKAIQGMDAWSSTMTGGPSGDNAALASGLCGYEFAVAGETLRGYAGWSQTSITNYQNFLMLFYGTASDYLIHHSIFDPRAFRSNWDIDNMLAIAAIGVFCDNTTVYNQAINYFKQGNGPGQIAGNGQVEKWCWYLFPDGTGQMEESNRDQAHCDDAVCSMAMLCEIAYHQGLDLYGYDNNRLLRGAEYYAKYNLGNNVSNTPYFNGAPWPSSIWETNVSSGGRGGSLPVWDLINAHFVQKGMFAPYTAAFAAMLRPSGNIGNWNSPDYLGYDTLTHYQDNPTTDQPPSSLWVNFDSRKATLSWWGTPRASSYNVKRATVSGGPYATIATTDASTVSYVDDQLLHGPTYYYAVSAMTPSGETANSPEAIGGCTTRYNFEGDASDSVGAFSGTLACSGTSGLPGFTAGHGGGQALSLNGIDQYVQLPLGVMTCHDITVSAWVKWGGGSAWQRIFDTSDPDKDRNMFLTVSDGGNLRFFITNGWQSNNATLYGPVPALNTWTHVAVTIKGSAATLYENGVPVDTEWVGTQPLFGQAYTYIGKSMYNDPYFNGAIDDFRVYNCALSGSDLYTLAGQGPNHSPQFVSDPIVCSAATEGVAYTGQSIFQKASDVDGGTLTFSKTGGPAWLSVAPNGALSGTPGTGDVGLAIVTVRVTDAAGATDDSTLYITVNHVNQAPQWTSSTISKPAINQNQPYSYAGATLAGNATDPDLSYGDSLTFSKVSGPAWLAVASSGTLSGTPGGSDAGLNTFTVRVTDASGLSADATLKITVVPYSLRSQYQFEGNLNDSVSGFTATANGSPAYVAGRINQAISLNGSTDFVTLPAGAANYNEITVAAWVYWNGGSNNQRVFDFGNGTSQYLELCPNMGSGMRFETVYSGTSQQINYSTPLPTGRWVHVAVALSGSVGTLYVNGTAVASNTNLTIRPTNFSPQTNYVGKSQWSADPLWNGKIDDFRIYNYALSASDISGILGSVAPLPPTGLTATGGNGSSQVTLSWSAAAGAASYNVKRATSPNGTYTTIYSGSATNFTDTTGTPGVTCYYVVTAVNAGGESAPSSAVPQLYNASAPRVYLRLDESSGATASDSSGNGWNGTLVNGPTWVAGKVNNAVNFNGSNNYVSIPSGVVASMTNCTIAAWVKVNSMSTWARIFDFGTGTANYMMVCPKNGNTGFLRYEIVSSGTVQQVNTSYTFPTGTWTHVALTLSGSTGTLYVNGTSMGTNTALTLNPSGLGATNQNYIGKSQWNDPYLNGAVDEFQIYPRALSSTELTALASGIAAPSNVTIASGNAQATLTWNAVVNATGYNLKRSGTSGGPYTVVQANVSGTTAIDTSLVNSTGYYYVVTALNGVAESPNSSEVTTTPVGAPPVPTSLQATGSNAVVSLAWTPSYGATSYNILRSLTSGSGYALSGTATSASYSDASALNGNTYYYVVNAVGANGQSANSSEVSAFTSPAAPTGVTASGSNGSIILNWSSTALASSYNIKRTTTSGSNYTTIASTNSPGYLDSGSNGTTYYYVISAQNLAGEGANSSQVSAAPLAPPSAPSGYVSAGSGSVNLLWSTISGASSYSVKRSGTSGGPYSVIYSGTATSYTDQTVTNGAAYYYILTASNAGGESGASSEMAANPAAYPLKAYLRFDEQTGSFAADSTGNGWSGTLVNQASWSAGKFNNAVAFNGSSQYVSLPVGVVNGAKDLTIAGWVKVNSMSTWARIFDFGTGTANYMMLCPKNGNTGFLRYEVVTSGTVQQINSSYTFPTGSWTHVALTLSGSTGTLYVNGTSVGTNTALTITPSNLGATSQNYIGKSQWNDPYLNGQVDDFRIYGRALSASEVVSLATPFPAPSSLTATAGYSQVALNWTSVSGATSYYLKRGTLAGGPYATITTLSGTTYTDTTTTPWSPYYYVVTSGSGLVESANSPQATATPLAPVPSITSATASSGTNGSGFSYQITASNAPTSFAAAGLPAGLVLNSVTGLVSGTPVATGTFAITLSASNDAGTGNASMTLTLQPPAPVITSSLARTGTNGSALIYQITATNSPSSFGATGLPAGLSVNTSTGAITGTPTVTGTYAVTLSASNGGGTGSATLQMLLISGSFGAPTGLSATAGVNAVSLAWTQVAGASSYNVKRTLTSGSNYTTVATGLSSPSYSDTGLTNRTTYFYVVSAVNSGGTESANSSEAGATPMPALTWIGTGADANWLTAANWSSQPGAGNPIAFDGSLRLSNTNNYATNTQFGGITFNSGAGAFSLNGNALNLAGDILNNSGTAQIINLNIALSGSNRTINTASADIAIAGAIGQSGGTYGLIKTGSGALTLSGTNTFAGGVILNQGYLNAESHAALGTGTVTLSGGTLRNATSIGGTRVLANPMTVPAGATGFVRGVATDFVLNGNLSGSGTLDLAGTYNAAGLRLSGSNSGFTGTVKITGPNLRLDTPDSGSPNAAWVVGVSGTGGLQLNASGTTNTFQFGSLSGNGCVEGHFVFSSAQVQTISVGALGIDSTFSGSIIDNATNNSAFGNGDGAANNVVALTKVGAGTLTLASTISYSGLTLVSAGTLKLNGLLSGTSAMTVTSGASLAGTGTSSGPVTIGSGAIIAPGDSGSGTLTINGALTLNDGSVLNVQLSGTGNSDQIILGSGLVSTGTITVNVAALSGFGEGTYPVMTGTAVVSSAGFAIGTVPPGYACTLSATNGVLSVTSILLPFAPTGLSATPGDTIVNLSWNTTATATSYNVKRSTTSGSGYVTVATGTATSFSDTGLTNGTTYYYVVSAVNAGGEGPNSTEVSAMPVPPAPVISGATSATGTTGSAFNYAITASNSPTSYAATGLPSGLSLNTSTGVISGTPAVTGSFNVTLSASNLGGTGTAPLALTVIPPAPVITSALTATGTNGTAFSYTITATNTPTSFAATGLPSGLSLNTSSGLINGTPTVTGTFTVSISASNAGGTGSASLVLSIATGLPGTPASLAAAGSNGAVTLNWGAATQAASYNVKRSLTSGTGYTTIASGVTATSYNDTAVTNWTTYYYVVSAVNSQGESANSSEASATPMPPDTWIGAGSDNFWQTAANWSTLPAAGDPLYFAGTTRLSATNNYVANTSFAGLTFNSGAGAFTLSGNAITLQGDVVNNSTNTQTLNLGLILTGSKRSINAASGNITMVGPITETGGSCGLIKTGNNSLSLSGSNTFSGGVSHGAGTISVASSSGSNYGPLGTGTLGLAGGTLNNTGAVSSVTLGNPVSISGTLSKIMVTASQNFQLNGTLSGSGVATLGGGSAFMSLYVNGTNSMTSGTVVFASSNNSLRILTPSFGNPSIAWVFNNTTANRETLDFTTGTISFGSMTGAGIVQGNNGTGTKTISVGGLGYNETFSGAIQDGAGTLALIKTGSGTFTLSGNNSYSGGTAINTGVLKITGTLSGAGGVSVNSGGTLAGTGTVAGAITLASGGALAPGDNGAGTLSLAGLTLNDGAVLNMELSGTGSSDKVVVSGAVSTSGTTMVNLTAQSGFGPGTYPLISGTSALNAANFNVGTAPGGYGYALSASGGILSVTVVAPPSTPTGLAATAGDSVVNLAWSASSGATSYNIKRSLASGGSYTVIASGTATSFTDTGLTDATAYYYVVSASNSAGESANSTQASAVPTNNSSLPRFSLSGDIGTTGATGTTSLVSGTYTMQGSGADIWGTADAFQFMYQQVAGDCDVRVRVTSVQNTDPWAKAGVMIRNSLAAGSQFADTIVTSGTGVSAQWRQTANGNCGFVQTTGLSAPYWVRLVRSGSNFTSYRSPDGATWTSMSTTAIAMNSTVYVGLAVTAHHSGTLCTAIMDNFSVVSLPSPWASSDVGTVGSAGSAKLTGSTYTIAGSGADIWSNADGFRYVYQPSTGDCDVTARVNDLSVSDASAKAVVMIRESLNANSSHAMVIVTPSSGIHLQWRSTTGSSTSSIPGPTIAAPCWIRLVRSGSTFTGYYSVDGTAWTSIGSTSITMASSANIGLGVTSHSDGVLCTATIDNVTANP